MSKQSQFKVKTTRSAELLLEFKKICDQKVQELRAEACQWAAKSREIEKMIPEEQIKEIADQHDADVAWSFNNGLLDVLTEGKKAAGTK